MAERERKRNKTIPAAIQQPSSKDKDKDKDFFLFFSPVGETHRVSSHALCTLFSTIHGAMGEGATHEEKKSI